MRHQKSRIMVNVKDLMVGNFVKDKNDEIMLVGKIHRESVADKWGGIAFDDEIDGIPMTIETLLAIGFTRVQDIRDYHYYRYWDKEGKYKLDVDYYFGNSEKKWHVHIDNDVCNTIGSGEFDYVHELQNLVRVITGQKLPITKEMLQ